MCIKYIKTFLFSYFYNIVCLFGMYEWICATKVHVPKHPLQFQIDEAARGLLTYCATLDTVIETSAADVQQLLKFHMLPARVQFFAAWEGTYLQ